MPSHKIHFTGSLGAKLAARLDVPDRAPRAYALFAHCFTCSKDIFAAARISAALVEHGIAVLRFDFTGLGHSEGEFASTNFSSNVQDLVVAAGYLRDHYKAPAILIGHSLGGAAVLAAAGKIAEVRAVATIGAPSDPSHVAHLFDGSLEEIEREGKAVVSLAGRPFTIAKQFLDDIREQTLIGDIGRLGKALLVMHGPRDQTVSIDNAAIIFGAAKHPKSFISLDDADHLLSRKEDARYAAEVLAAWANRYIDASPVEEAAGASEGDVIVAETGEGRFQQIITVGQHTLLADEPPSVGGGDSGLTPYDLLLAGLGACTNMTLRMYAARKKIPLERCVIRLRHKKIHGADCEQC
ncbi:MAG: bifunctional alpha/beta hydrolase/OsmC family protein, partial [Alphaproteobacteria bacterium]